MVKFCDGTWSGHWSSSRKGNDVEKSLFMYFFFLNKAFNTVGSKMLYTVRDPEN